MAVAFDPFAIAADLAQCICLALKDEERGENVWAGNCCVRPGSQVAWDTCCEDGGQAWVVVQNGFPTVAFPTTDTMTSETTCSNGVVSLAVNFEIGVLRCATSGDCDAAEQESALLFDDLKAAFRGLNCCFTAASDGCDRGWRLNNFEMVGPQGGCAGFTINISVNMDYPCCPPTT